MKTFDTIIIELQKDKKSIASISLDYEDMKNLEKNFGKSREEIISNMIETLEYYNNKKLEETKTE